MSSAPNPPCYLGNILVFFTIDSAGTHCGRGKLRLGCLLLKSYLLFNLRILSSNFHLTKNTIMKNLRLVVLLCLSIAVCMPLNGLFAQKDVSKEIQAANDNFMMLFKAGDVDQFLSVYTDDARLLPPNSPVVVGKENFRPIWQGMMDAGITPKLTTASALAHGKTAIEEGTVEIYAGDQLVDNVKYIVIWKKVKGEWKMYQDIWNSSNPVADH